MPTHHLTMHQAAQQLSYGRNKLFTLLRRHGVLNGNNQPKGRWVREGYFKTDLRQRVTSFNQYQPYYVTLVTVEGLGFLRQLIDEQTTPKTTAATASQSSEQQRQAATPLRRRDRRAAQPATTSGSTGTGAAALSGVGAQSGDSQLPAPLLPTSGLSTSGLSTSGLSTQELSAPIKAAHASSTAAITRSHA